MPFRLSDDEADLLDAAPARARHPRTGQTATTAATEPAQGSHPRLALPSLPQHYAHAPTASPYSTVPPAPVSPFSAAAPPGYPPAHSYQAHPPSHAQAHHPYQVQQQRPPHAHAHTHYYQQQPLPHPHPAAAYPNPAATYTYPSSQPASTDPSPVPTAAMTPRTQRSWHLLSSPTAIVVETPDRDTLRASAAAADPTARVVSQSAHSSAYPAPVPTIMVPPTTRPRIDSGERSPTPVRKRRRLVRKGDLARDLDDDDDDAPIPVPPAPMAVVARPEAQLVALFPAVPRSRVALILENCREDVAAATARLQQFVAAAPQRAVGASTGPGPARRTVRSDAPAPPLPPPVVTLDDDGEDEAEESDASSDNDDHTNAQATVDFFNSATADLLLEFTQCTPAQAKIVAELRPYASEDDLYAKITAKKGVTVRILDNYEATRAAVDAMDKIIAECETIGEDLTNITSTWHDENSTTHHHLLRTQPALVNPALTLKSYQLVGVSWLTLLYQRGLAGILADDMGLGKTAQVIAFLANLLELGHRGPHLIVCPASTLDNWLRELARWVPGHVLRVASYSGSQAERTALQSDIRYAEDPYNVVVTTYNVATGGKDDRAFLRKMKFRTMILDEGHFVKNADSMRYKHLMAINAPFRLLTTGTPMQNDLQELLALLTFIMPALFASAGDAWQRIFKLKSLEAISAQRIDKVRRIMAPFVLRRKKTQVLADLPPKHVRVAHCTLEGTQRVLYDELVRASQEAVTAGAAKQFKNYLMDLRKAAAHPLLFRRRFDDATVKTMARNLMKEEPYWDANVQYVTEDLLICSDFELEGMCRKYPKSLGKFALQNEEWMQSAKFVQLKEVLREGKDKGDRCLIFSQFTMCLDVLEAFLTTLGYKYLRLDGTTPVVERQGLVDEFQENEEIFVFLLSTKAGGLGLNLTAANTVIIHDLDFNPFNDAQACDRAWRLGQTRPVQVIKLVCKDTIEDVIYRRQEAKLILDQRLQEGVGAGGDAAATGNSDEDDASLAAAVGGSLERDVMQIMATQLAGGDTAVAAVLEGADSGDLGDEASSILGDDVDTASWGTNSVTGTR
ncbi:hypothetical protein AMAG_11492 [Allomyces macrogynus ATCC 38327]|uniref:Uncharacterized protein n=1 Tax=Allomyces macrogynus (strain ATCC 38327) TaxID=578462 RepID=A0A0L0SVH1_ALLM3|nr:hypothetical protein AMAG_11492 [Allomyces macrogynus ATCC 38327]|eukprot:KNE66349.1 hypothetical protein AMAG_11492 [Allomyces macrogynus ATCC 38327]